MGKQAQIKEDWSPFQAYGKRRKPLNLPDCALFCAVAVFAAFLWCRASALPQYDWNWRLLGEFLLRRGEGGWEPGLLLRGLWATVRIGFWTFLFSLFAGMLLGAASARKAWLPRLLCGIYVNIARNTPPLVLLFCVYFFAGNFLPVGALEDALRHAPAWLRSAFGDFFAQPGQLDRMIAAVLALGCYQAAYVAEIMRGGIESVPREQWDAALALGFRRRQALRLVVLPQALRWMLPPLTSQAITTFKDTALASLISLPELTFQSLEIMSVSGMTFEVWISCAALYLCLGGVCALAGLALERKFHFKH